MRILNFFIAFVWASVALAGGNAVKNEEPNPFRFPKNGEYYLERNTEVLESYLEQVKKQTLEKNYPLYSTKPVIWEIKRVAIIIKTKGYILFFIRGRG